MFFVSCRGKISSLKTTTNTLIKRGSCGNSSFTAGITNNSSNGAGSSISRTTRELGRFANLNRSFNNVAKDFRKKIPIIESNSENHLIDDLLNAGTSGGSLMSNLSQRVKHQVKSSLSEPLKGRELLARISTGGSNNLSRQCEEECGYCLICQPHNNLSDSLRLYKNNSVRKRINILSNKLQLPKFLIDNNNGQDERYNG